MNNTLGQTYDNSQSVLFTLGVLLICSCGVASLYWTNNATLLNYLFPFLAIVLGILLYLARPALYIGFCFWIWFITPFIRRIVDYQMGEFTSVSLIMLTPYLVSAVSIFTLFRFFLFLKRRQFMPYTLAFLGIGYGYAVGIVKAGLFSATFNLIEWLVPLLCGFHVLATWKVYPEYRSSVRAAFTYGLIIMGFYGILQFVMPSPWDVFWMEQSGMTSIGHPEPFRLRAFSMLNAPGPFAMVTMAGLMLLFDGRGIMARVAILPGYASFLLTAVRGAWGGWVVALIFTITRMSGVMRTRLLGLLGFGIVIMLPLVFLAPSESVGRVEERMGTFGNLEEDGSLNARLNMYQNRGLSMLANPVGEGLGHIGRGSRDDLGETRNLDSGILALFVSLGWLGATLYMAGVGLMFWGILKNRNWTFDRFAILTASVGVSYMVLMLMANQVLSIKGIIVWVFLSLSLASRWYYDQALRS